VWRGPRGGGRRRGGGCVKDWIRRKEIRPHVRKESGPRHLDMKSQELESLLVSFTIFEVFYFLSPSNYLNLAKIIHKLFELLWA
jgi:hypothetical protein